MVRIFSKASAEPGELGALLAVVNADATGAWAATYAKQPVGTLVTATQTSDAGTAGSGHLGARRADHRGRRPGEAGRTDRRWRRKRRHGRPRRQREPAATAVDPGRPR